MTDAQIRAHLSEPHRSHFDTLTRKAERIEGDPGNYDAQQAAYRSITEALSDLEDMAFHEKYGTQAEVDEHVVEVALAA